MMNDTKLEKIGFILILLMIVLQGFYGLYSYIDPVSFSNLRGTELYSSMDSDWIQIYGSRTLFITLVLSYLLYTRNYLILMWCALFGSIMPITDAFLAYEAQAPIKVVLKHVATVVYLLVTYFVFKWFLEKKSIN